MKAFIETNNIEYKRSWRDEWLKWICAFANAQGGKLYIGIDEKSREVVGVENPQRLLEDIPNKVIASMGIMPKFEIVELDGKRIVLITVSPASYPVSYHGEFHLRVGATKQLLTGLALTEFILRRTGQNWDAIPIDGVTVEDLDHESLDIFRRRAIESQRMAEDDVNIPTQTLLENLQLVSDGKLTRAAVLLFHAHPERWVSTCYSKIGMFATADDIRFQDEIRGSLIVQAEKLIDCLFSKYTIAPITYHDMTRVDQFPYPKDGMRELVRNALMHQDFVNGQPVQLSVHPDRIYLMNAGGLPQGWRVEQLFEKHGSQPRNRLIANAFYRGGFVETWGRGIEKVRTSCRKWGIPDPEYVITDSDVMVSLKARIPLDGTLPRVESGQSRGRVESIDERVLIQLQEGECGKSALAASCALKGVSGALNRAVTRLLASGMIERTIAKPNSRFQKYRLTEKGLAQLQRIDRKDRKV